MPININIGDSYHSVWQLGIWSQKKMLMNRALKLLLLFNFNMISQRHARHNHLIPYVRENNSTAERENPIFWTVVLLHPYIYICTLHVVHYVPL